MKDVRKYCEGEKMTRKRLEKKICPQCKVEKRRDEYYEKVTKYTTKSGVTENKSLRLKCKSCMSENAKERWKSSEEYKTNHYRASRKNLLKKYGLTEEEYKEKCEEVDHRCAICNQKQEKLVVDHCHSSGLVRGFLCKKCNSALGLFKENTSVVLKAAEYLNAFDSRHRNKSNP